VAAAAPGAAAGTVGAALPGLLLDSPKVYSPKDRRWALEGGQRSPEEEEAGGEGDEGDEDGMAGSDPGVVGTAGGETRKEARRRIAEQRRLASATEAMPDQGGGDAADSLLAEPAPGDLKHLRRREAGACADKDGPGEPTAGAGGGEPERVRGRISSVLYPGDLAKGTRPVERSGGWINARVAELTRTVSRAVVGAVEARLPEVGPRPAHGAGDTACPVSTGGGTRRVRLVRGGRRGVSGLYGRAPA
jgi:hypothetical protein